MFDSVLNIDLREIIYTNDRDIMFMYYKEKCMKSRSVDERLSDALEYLCEKEKCDPTTLAALDDFNPFRDVRDIAKLKETIVYLKNYAKLQIVAKTISEDQSLATDIAEEKKRLEELIEQTKQQIADLPKVERQPKKGLMYEYGEEFANSEIIRIARAREERKNTLLAMREQIRSYKRRITELGQIEKKMGNPNKLIEQFFPEESSKLQTEYSSLVDICARTMHDGINSQYLVGEEGIFKFDGHDYNVNNAKARKFISLVKARKVVLSSAEYLTANRNFKNRERDYNEVLKRKEDIERAESFMDTPKFSAINKEINNIIENYNELDYREKKYFNNNIFNRINNTIRDAFRLPPSFKPSRKIRKMRDQLSTQLKDFANQIRQDSEMKEAFGAYKIVRNTLGDGIDMDPARLVMDAQEVVFNGTPRLQLPVRSYGVEQLKIQMGFAKSSCESRLIQCEVEKAEAEKVKDELYQKLSKRAQKIVDSEKEETILGIAKKYYGFGEIVEAPSRRREMISSSAAAIILESILKRKNLSWEDMFSVYDSSIGATKQDEDQSLKKMIDEKVNFVRNQLGLKSKEEQVRDEV